YRIELAPEAVRDLRKLDRQAAIRVQRFLRERVGVLDDPRLLGGPLVGVPYWRYRVGDYRILVEFQDAVLLVLVVEIGHRSEVYRRR
ncbi:MAG: type II toxin-antitoxin system RelE family toxin, partial [Pseudonocardia sp.]